MVCSKCLLDRHIRCMDPIACTCRICEARRHGDWVGDPSRSSRKSPTVKVHSQGVDGKRVTTTVRRGSRASDTHRTQMKAKYGIFTDFTDKQVMEIFWLKEHGHSLSSAARSMNSTRDKIRTVYNAPTAPEVGEKDPVIMTTASEHLAKAKGALDHARELTYSLESGPIVDDKPHVERTVKTLIELAGVQAAVAQAEALTRIADLLSSGNSDLNLRAVFEPLAKEAERSLPEDREVPVPVEGDTGTMKTLEVIT